MAWPGVVDDKGLEIALGLHTGDRSGSNSTVGRNTPDGRLTILGVVHWKLRA